MAAMVLMCPRLGAPAYGSSSWTPGPRVRRGTRRVFCPNAKAAAEQHVVAKKSVVPRRTAQKRPNDRFLKAFVCWFLKAPWKGVVPNPGGKLHNESNGSNPLGDPTWKSLRPESGRSGKDPFLSQWHPPQIDHSILTMGRNENSKVHTFWISSRTACKPSGPRKGRITTWTSENLKSSEQAGHREMLFVRHGRVDVREWFGFLELSLQTPGSKIMEASDQQCWNVCFIS